MQTLSSMLTLTQTKRVLRSALYTPTPWGWGIPVLLGGIPGGGKTAIVRDLCAEMGLGKAEVLAPGERGEGAFGVVPVPDMDLGVLTYPAPDWAARFIRRDAVGVVFVDEITTADPSLQPALLGLVLSRRIGGAQLGQRVRVICAGNLGGQGGANVSPLSAANANRCLHLPFPVACVGDFNSFNMGRDVFAQMEGEVTVTVNADEEEARVRAGWGPAFARAAGIVAGFLDGHGAHLHKMPEEGSDEASGAWPSPRTWDMATLALAGASLHGLDEDEVDAMLAGCVGVGPAAELRAYLGAMDLPNVARVLDGLDAWLPDPSRPDVIAAVLATGAALVAAKTSEKRLPRSLALWDVLASVCDVAADMAVPAVQALVQARLFAAKSASCRKVCGTSGVHGMLPAAAAGAK